MFLFFCFFVCFPVGVKGNRFRHWKYVLIFCRGRIVLRSTPHHSTPLRSAILHSTPLHSTLLRSTPPLPPDYVTVAMTFRAPSAAKLPANVGHLHERVLVGFKGSLGGDPPSLGMGVSLSKLRVHFVDESRG